MPREELGHIWVCCQCQKSFLYKEDKEEHIRMTGHSDLKMYDLAELLDSYEGANIQKPGHNKLDGEFS